VKIKIKKGTIAYTGMTGHRGFEYPTKNCESLLFDVEAEFVPWVGGGEKFRPVRIPESSILALGDSTKNIVVWVHKT